MTNYDYLMQASGLAKRAGVVKRASAYDTLMAVTGVAQQEKSALFLPAMALGAGGLYAGQKLWNKFTAPSEKEKKWDEYQKGLERDKQYRANGWMSKEDLEKQQAEQYKQDAMRYKPLDQITDPQMRQQAMAARSQANADQQFMHQYNVANMNRQSEMNQAQFNANQAAVGGLPHQQPGYASQRQRRYGSNIY